MVATQPAASCSNISELDSRESPRPPSSSRRQGQVALFGCAADHLDREVMFTVPVRSMGRQLPSGEGSGAVGEQALFVTEFEVHGISLQGQGLAAGSALGLPLGEAG